MYLGRHYPRWKNGVEGYWFEVDGTSATKVPPFFYSITPIFEGQDDDEWHGMLYYTLHVVNPLRLKYPDTTNSGEANVDFISDVYDDESLVEALDDLAESTTFSPPLCMGYNSATQTANDLLSTQSRFHCNYWTASFSIYDLFVEDETPEESLARIKAEHPVFNVIEASILDGDMTNGLIAGTLRFGEEVSDQMPEPLTNDDIGYVRRFRAHLRQEAAAVTDEMELVHFNCETGARHQCKYGDEHTVAWRGQLQGDDIFEQFMEGVKQESIEVSPTVLNNFRELTHVYQGDCRALMPMLTADKDIILHWRPGPRQVNTVLIRSDGTMFIRSDHLPRSPALAHIDGYKEMKVSERFDANVLTRFIAEGDLAHD